MEHFYQNIHGWFDYEKLYSSMVNKFEDGSRFVEVGVWKGKSAVYMAVEILNSGKTIKFDCVDTWDGSKEHVDKNSICYEPLLETKDGLYNHYLENISPVKEYINSIRLPSLSAAKNYDDESLDFVFIDASHDYENVKQDIISWLPKIKKNGILAGHDYTDWVGVRRAVDELFDDKRILGSCWVYDKI